MYDRMSNAGLERVTLGTFDPRSPAFFSLDPIFQLDALKTEIDAQGILAEKLSTNSEARKEWMDANRKLEALRNKYEAIPNDAAPDQKQNEEMMDAWRTIRRSITELREKIYSIQQPLWKEGQNELEKYRKRSEYASWLSALLFTVGWGLGIAGKLFGVSADGGAE
jgi:DNA repair ATPase RecN